MRIERRYTKEGKSAYAEIVFRLTTSEIRNPDGSVVFQASGVEVPEQWSQVASDVLAQKYFRKAGVPACLKKVEEETVPSWLWRSVPDEAALAGLPEKDRFVGETSCRQVFDRLAGTWTYWGWKGGYFSSEADAQAFFDGPATCSRCRWWRRTRRNGSTPGFTGPTASTARARDIFSHFKTGKLMQSATAYEHPQPHACFIQSISDDLVNEGGIMDLWVREARLLRGNSGGIMEAAIQIADQFLKEGQLIVYTKGRASPRNEARATGKGEFETGDLVVLIDEWSASASEILAGALQDNDRGTIIGRRSFGKGLVQEPIPFSDGSGMRLTIARYYTPTGRSIQKPYKDGFEKYFDDLNQRYTHGEFEVPDSIHFSDSLKFVTPGGHIVYGGGGIMPDKFVPVDTTGISPYFVKARSFIYKFALKYTESNRELLKKYTTAGEMKNYLDKQPLLDQFVKFAAFQGLKKDPDGLKISGNIIHIQIEAYIARNILDNKGFYPIWQEIDTTLKYAIDFLKK